jgi:hypothetical protein
MKKPISNLLITLMIVSSSSYAQENLSYQKPPESILQLADYERAPAVALDTRGEYMLLTYRSAYKTLDDLNQDEISLGGLRVNPVTNIASNTNYISNLKIRKVKDKEPVQVAGLPENPRIAYVTWSPDEKKIAFTQTASETLELWVLDIASATAKKNNRPRKCKSRKSR